MSGIAELDFPGYTKRHITTNTRVTVSQVLCRKGGGNSLPTGTCQPLAWPSPSTDTEPQRAQEGGERDSLPAGLCWPTVLA